MRLLFLVLLGFLCTLGAVAQKRDSVPPAKAVQDTAHLTKKQIEKREKADKKAKEEAYKAQQKKEKEALKAKKKKEKLDAEVKEAKKNALKDSARLAIENVTKQAVRRSLILPGWGQIYNSQQWHLRKDEMKRKGVVSPKLWWLSVPAIYGGFVSVGLMYEFNNRYYHIFLKEVQYRLANNGQWLNEDYQYITQDYAIRIKDMYRRNRDLSIILFAGVYTINVIEAYVNSVFLRYDIEDDLTLKISPSLQQTPGVMGWGSVAPGIKLTFALR
ncbi:hypothetical protein SAMN05216436_11946 [bacterium A37T11]|nr:hypothetical protein SAMN05216436_11946 [bacterium A37T11]